MIERERERMYEIKIIEKEGINCKRAMRKIYESLEGQKRNRK